MNSLGNKKIIKLILGHRAADIMSTHSNTLNFSQKNKPLNAGLLQRPGAFNFTKYTTV